MEEIILEEIPFDLEPARLMKRVRTAPGFGFDEELERLAAEAREVARPRALYRLGYPEPTGEDRVTIGGVELKSRVLRVNLEQAHRVFLYADALPGQWIALTQKQIENDTLKKQ